MRTHRRLLASTLLATAGLLTAIPACAQHAAPADPVLLADLSEKEAMGGELDAEKASAIQTLILNDWLERELGSETEAGVLTTV
ncbi:MAG: hypothetical protein JKY78_08460, partial [Hyphomonas sp.]|nr:hypothetical protein [Hyphomonas sp.]